MNILPRPSTEIRTVIHRLKQTSEQLSRAVTVTHCDWVQTSSHPSKATQTLRGEEQLGIQVCLCAKSFSTARRHLEVFFWHLCLATVYSVLTPTRRLEAISEWKPFLSATAYEPCLREGAWEQRGLFPAASQGLSAGGSNLN